MKKFFTLFKGKAAASKAVKAKAPDYSDSVNIEAVQLLAKASENANQDIHIKMVFNEAGEMVACKVDHFKDEAPLESSTESTIVEASPVLAAKPASPVLPAFSQELPVADLKRAAAARVTPATTTTKPAPALTTADFKVFKVLGKGGQGRVLLVQHRASGLLYALKVIVKAKLNTRNYPVAFQEQATSRALAGNHFFAQLQASFEDDKHFFLLSNFYPGDLASRIQLYGKIEAVQARLYCAQLILAMEELHRRRIMHRDLKPQNVLITRDNELVLADFGLTRTYGRLPEEEPWRLHEFWDHRAYAHMPREEATGDFVDATRRHCGTIAYLAPEVAAGEAYSYPADVFSLGVMFYEMLNGKLPFGVTSAIRDQRTVEARIKYEQVEVNDDVEVEAHDLLYMMLEKEPSRRPSLEQIKEHPWFASIDWNQLAQREQPRPFRPAEGVKPTKEALEVQFGNPYPEGVAPHPWYQWVSPNLQTSRPSVRSSRTTSTTRQTAASPTILAQPVSPALSSFAEYFAPAPAARAPPAAFPAFFAPPSHDGSAPVSPAAPAPVSPPASSASPACMSFSHADARSPPSSPALAPSSPRGLGRDRPATRRCARSMQSDVSLEEDTRPALEAEAGAGPTAPSDDTIPDRAAAVLAAVVHKMNANDAAQRGAPAPAGPHAKFAGHPPVDWDTLKLLAKMWLFAMYPSPATPLPPAPEMTSDATCVATPLLSQEVQGKSMSVKPALAPRARERSPWAFV